MQGVVRKRGQKRGVTISPVLYENDPSPFDIRRAAEIGVPQL